jgi:hypothetical protein
MTFIPRELLLVVGILSAAGPAFGQESPGADIPDPSGTRLFMAPTARSLPAGTSSLGMYQILVPGLQVGVTDRFSIGGGTPLFFGVPARYRPVWITPKLQIANTGRTQAAVGAAHAFNFDGASAGLAYGVATTGTKDASVTAMGGMVYGVDDVDRALFVGMIGGERRIGRRVKVVTENHVYTGGGVLLMNGFRFLRKKGSIEAGFAVAFSEARFAGAFPVISFVRVF